jgi:hypothetical protein
MKRSVIFLTAAILLLAIVLTFGPGCSTKRVTYGADLSGGNETPPVTTSTTGHLDITFNAARTEAKYKLIINGGVGVISSEMHIGTINVSGSRVALLFGNPAGLNVTGTLIEGALTDYSVFGGLTSLTDLESAIMQGEIYCNVHTLANPNGAIRGQVH